MKKEDLLAQGLSEEQATKVLGLYKASLDDNFVAKHRFDEVSSELKTAKAQITDRDKQIADLSKAEGTSKDLQAKLQALEEENKTKDKQYKAELVLEKKKNAVRMALIAGEDKPHDPDMILGLLDLNTIEYDEAGSKLGEGFQKQFDTIKTGKPFLFAPKDPTPPAQPQGAPGWKPTGTPPANGSNGGKGDPIVDYGKGLAQAKLGMLGVNTAGKSDPNPTK